MTAEAEKKQLSVSGTQVCWCKGQENLELRYLGHSHLDFYLYIYTPLSQNSTKAETVN